MWGRRGCNYWCVPRERGRQCPAGFSFIEPPGAPADIEQVLYIDRNNLAPAHALDPNGAPSGKCPFVATHDSLYESNQGNNFLKKGGPLYTLFEEEYLRWVQSLLRMPQMQPCAVTDAVEVLLHPQHGIIREAFDEDREFWHRDVGINAGNRLSFIQAWTRLRFASVTQELQNVVARKWRIFLSTPFLATRTEKRWCLASNLARASRAFLVAPRKPLSSFLV